MNKSSTLDREFLELRGLLLQAAAGLDRLDRCPDSSPTDPRREKLVQAAQILASGAAQKALGIQQLFSRPYDPGWQTALGMDQPD